MTKFLLIWVLSFHIIALSKQDNRMKINISVITQRSTEKIIILKFNIPGTDINEIEMFLVENIFAEDAKKFAMEIDKNVTKFSSQNISYDNNLYSDTTGKTILIIENTTTINGIFYEKYELQTENGNFYLQPLYNQTANIGDEFSSLYTSELHKMKTDNSSRIKRQSRYSNRIDVCLLVDQSFINHLNLNPRTTVENYFATVWNKVKLIYNRFINLDIKLRKIFYNNHNIFVPNYNYNNLIVMDSSQQKLNYAVQRHDEFNQCHYVYFVTNQRTYNYIGWAPIRGCCTNSKAAIGYDDARYGITLPAHELGHFLGSQHDGEGNNCHYYGYVMYKDILDYIKNTNRHTFSTCSQKQIKNHVQNHCARCFY